MPSKIRKSLAEETTETTGATLPRVAGAVNSGAKGVMKRVANAPAVAKRVRNFINKEANPQSTATPVRRRLLSSDGYMIRR